MVDKVKAFLSNFKSYEITYTGVAFSINDIYGSNNWRVRKGVVDKYKNIFFISINDSPTSNYFLESWFKKDHENVKVLYFDDVENENETSPTNSGKCTPFSAQMAKDLYDFIKDNIDKAQCIVHCEAGISRSGAVGDFICGISGSNYFNFKHDNPHIRPNARVLRMLNEINRNYKNKK